MLANEKCEPCESGGKALRGAELQELQRQLGNDWKIVEEHHLEKTFPFKNFQEALDFTNRIGAIAESVGHHPDIYLTWGKVRVTIFTHSIDGLTKNDFILAAKFDDSHGK